MDRFFNTNNGLMRALAKIFDMGWLSIIYVLFCVPIVTIGAATTSLYYVSAKVLRRDRSYVWTEFWSSFKQNFAQSTIIWVIFMLVYGLLYFNINMVGITDTESQYGGYLAGVYIALGLIALSVMSYVFSVVSRFRLKLGEVFRISLYFAFRHIVHTILMVLILFVAGAGVYVGFAAQVPFLLIFVPGLAGFLYTFPMEHVLKKHMPAREKRYTEDGEEILEWYEE